MNTLQIAVNEYQDRKDRITNPDGKFDNGGRWYPSDEEKCKCCQSIRNPSARWPYSLIKHCRTITHVANLYNVSDKEMRKLII